MTSVKIRWQDYNKPARPKQLDQCLVTLRWHILETPRYVVYPAIYTEGRGFLLTCPNDKTKGPRTPLETGVFDAVMSWALMPEPCLFEYEEDLLS